MLHLQPLFLSQFISDSHIIRIGEWANWLLYRLIGNDYGGA
jgi:hypothetical protein